MAKNANKPAKKASKKAKKQEKPAQTNVPLSEEEARKQMMEKMKELQSQKIEVPGMGNLSGVELIQKIQLMQKELGTQGGMQRTAGDILQERELKLLNQYAANVVQKFGRYIKSVVAFGGTKRHKHADIDVAVLVDDTDVTRLSRGQLKEKLFQRLIEVAYVTDKAIHPQPYLLTEFWEYVRHGNPVLFNVLRTGIPLYDTGFFLPVQMIFKQGLINPSAEAIDKHIILSVELLNLTEDMMNKKMIYNLEQAVVAAGQAVLMECGFRPPGPREVGEFMQKLVEDKKIEKKYADFATDIVLKFKETEHGTLKEISGKEIDVFLDKTRDFVKRMDKFLKDERKRKGEDYKFDISKAMKPEEESEEDKKVKRPGLIDMERKPVAETSEASEKIIEEGLGQR